MHLDQIPRRLQKLAREGLEYRIGPASSPEAIDAAEARLGVTFPSQVRQFYGAINGIEVVEPPFRLYPLTEVDREGAFLKFCLCDHVHQLAFDTRALNEAGQWFIVNAATGYRITYTFASFWSIRMWSWIQMGRPIWYDFHGESPVE